MHLEDVVVDTDHYEVLMEVDDSILMIVDDPQRILDQQLGPRPIHSLNGVITLFI
jgi:hypothetical protein